jgi:hypothetical protein
MQDALPFGAHIHEFSPVDLLFLPEPGATLIYQQDQASLLGPHGRIFFLPQVRLTVSLRPEFIKLILGNVSRTLNGRFTSLDLSSLTAFDGGLDREDLTILLHDARRSVAEIWDEKLFVNWWIKGPRPKPADRRLQRVCLRYGGQNPQTIQQIKQIGGALGQYLTGKQEYLNSFSDQSHFIRRVREVTGRTPAQIKKMSDSFYLSGLIRV